MAKVDYELIYLQSENARIGLKGLSCFLKKSSQRLKYSVSSLEKENIIKNPYCIFDYSYFGLILFRAYFKSGYISEQDKIKIIKELESNPYITSIYELTGEFDFVVEFSSPNPSKFNKELKKIATLYPMLNDYKIILNIVTYLYPKDYLIDNSNLHVLNSEKVIGGDRDIETFNENEIKVIKNLILNPTIRITDLASRTELNIKTVKSIFKNLTRKSIVKGFKYNLDINKLNINKSRLFLKLHNLTLERESRIMQYMLNNKEIVQVNKTVGDWDMEIDIETLDKSRIRNIITQIREEFSDLIEKFNLIEFYKYYKRSYLPSYLFKEEVSQDKLVVVPLEKLYS